MLAIALLVGVELFAWFYIPADEMEAQLYSLAGYGAIFDGSIVLYILLSITRLLILVGLLSFHPTARTLFLLLTIAIFGFGFVSGYNVSSPLIAPFDFLATLIDGIIIAFAYYTPVSERFKVTTMQSGDATM